MRMLPFKKFLLQEGVAGLGDPQEHLTHLEDLIIEHGLEGFKRLETQVMGMLKTLNALEVGDDVQGADINLKVDGAPAVYFGVDTRREFEGQFFVGTKHDLSNKLQTVCHSEQEIKTNHAGKTILIEKLIAAYNSLKPLYLSIADKIQNRIIQTDMLFSKTEEKKVENIDSYPYITFHPQLIKYAIPIDDKSKLFNAVNRAVTGFGVHDTWVANIEEFNGRDRIMLRDSDKSKIQVISDASPQFNVFIVNGTFTKEDTNITVQDESVKKIVSFLSIINNNLQSVDQTLDNLFFPKEGLRHKFILEITSYINSEIRKGDGSFYNKAIHEDSLDNKYLNSTFNKFIQMKSDKKKWSKRPDQSVGFEGKLKGPKGLETINNWKQETLNNFKIFKPYINAMFYCIKLKVELIDVFDELDSSLKIGKVFYENPDGSFSADRSGKNEYGRGEGFAVFTGKTHTKLLDRENFSRRNLTNPRFGN